MKFTIGNWYRWDSGFNYPDGLKYFKLISHNSIKRELHYSDRIDNNSKHSYKKDFCNGTEHDKDLVEVSITEIQSYLPNGHIDKLSKEIELIEGNWYYVEESFSKNKWYYKYLIGCRKTTASKGVNISNGNKFTANNIIEDRYITLLKPADMEEIYKYFPEEKPKKLTNKDMIVGELYKHKARSLLAYYCGKDSLGKPFFELKDYVAVTFDIDELPKGWISKGNNTYWAYNSLETEFDLTLIKEDIKTNQLFTFPINGSCNTIDERLINFLKNRQSSKLIGSERNSYSAGIGWNSSSYWYFANSSEKPLYTIEQLEPFLKDVYMEKSTILTNLPERWVIWPSEGEEFKQVTNWAHEISSKQGYNQYIWHSEVNWNHLGEYKREEDCIKITFDEFKKWVLKETVPMKEEENLVGRWVKAIVNNPWGSSMKAGKYYKIVSDPKDSNSLRTENAGYIERIGGGNFELMPIGFIPPSKEECKFVVGKWYDCECYSNKEKRTIKIEKIENSCIWGDYIQNSKFWKNGCYQISQVVPIKEVSINEIQSYLPDGHPDKKSSIPEYVECRNNKGYSNPFTIGKVYKLISITGDNPRLKDDNDKEISIYRGLNHPNPEKECTCFILSNYSAYLAQNSPKMSLEEELFTEAKRRYPEGCIIKKMSSNTGRLNSSERYKVGFSRGEYHPDTKNFFLEDNLLVYMDGKWAEIVEYPKIYDNKLIQEMKDFSKYWVVHNPYEKKEGGLLSLQDNEGFIDPSVTKTKSVRTELVGEQEEVMYF